MSDLDALMIGAGGVLTVWWLVKHPDVATGLGLALLVGLFCFGAAHAATHPRRQHRRTLGGRIRLQFVTQRGGGVRGRRR
jgi:hypothetical protein